MNYYFDFDNTLYETAKLTEVMLNAIVNSIYNKTGKNLEDLKKYAKENFNSTTGNIFNFAEEMAEKFKSDKNKVLEDVKKLDDVYERIKDLKLNDERLEQKIEKVSEYINREICTQLNNNIISHKEYLNYIESITEEKEEETL